MSKAPIQTAAEDVLCASDAAAFLRSVLEARKAKNPRYSLRSFARALAVPSSTLNAMMKGTRPISAQQAIHLSNRLGLSKLEQGFFQLFVERAETPAGDRLERVIERQKRLRWLIHAERGEEVDSLDFEPEWYHLALFVAAARMDRIHRADLVAVGERIGLKADVAGAAVDLLIQKKLLIPAADGTLRREVQRVLLTTDAPNAAFRRIHFAMTERALEALETLGPDRRYSATEFVAFDQEAFSRFKDLTNNYLDRAQYESNTNTGSDLYCLSVHAFRLQKETST